MPKGKKGSKDNPLKSTELEKILNVLAKPKRSFKIMEAAIKDDFCNYHYENIEGIGIGDKHKVIRKKAGYIKDDMKKAFAKLNAHIAFIDDIFSHAGNDVEDIDMMHAHEFTFLYTVTAFRISGDEENESVILVGDKFVNIGGRITLETPKIPIDNSSSYKWYNELKTAIDVCREEVALYAEGKYHPIEVPEDIEDPNQMKMSFSINGKEVGGEGGEGDVLGESDDKPTAKELMAAFDEGAQV